MKQAVVKCDVCGGHYVAQMAADSSPTFCCSNTPRCSSTKSVCEFVLAYIRQYGINVYRWGAHCWNCCEITPIYTYRLIRDLAWVSPFFNSFPEVMLGTLPSVDAFFIEHFDSVKGVGKAGRAVNTCIYCGAQQGQVFRINDHALFLKQQRASHANFCMGNIVYPDTAWIENDIKAIFDCP